MGFIPNSKYYSNAFKNDRWVAHNIISIAIGQGEILATPLQLANYTALIANRGYYHKPHVVKARKGAPLDTLFSKRRESNIRREHFELTVAGMADAVTHGTCRRANMEPFLTVCGKTGTAENPHGEDHSLFIGFAPKDDPKVAIAVICGKRRLWSHERRSYWKINDAEVLDGRNYAAEPGVGKNYCQPVILPFAYRRNASAQRIDSTATQVRNVQRN